MLKYFGQFLLWSFFVYFAGASTASFAMQDLSAFNTSTWDFGIRMGFGMTISLLVVISAFAYHTRPDQ